MGGIQIEAQESEAGIRKRKIITRCRDIMEERNGDLQIVLC